jgi:DMSO reductase family type II enzyme chaperone
MPTPSDVRNPKSEVRRGEWAAHTDDTPKRSVFGNYRPDPEPAATESVAVPSPPTPADLQDRPDTTDTARARAFLYRFLARAYEDPTPAGWALLCASDTQEHLTAAWEIAGDRCAGSPPAGAPASHRPAEETAGGIESPDCAPIGNPRDGRPEVCAAFTPEAFDAFLDAYLAAFGHAARGPCPLNEIEYGDLKADPLFQPHRLADLAAFYRAFGLEVADDAGERHDHLCLELEFMCVLAAKEAWAREHQLDAEPLAVVRDAQKKFLREHLGRWTPAFTRRLERHAAGTPLAALARFTRAFILAECARLGVPPGSEDLLLRPADQAAALCESCGLAQALPGAAPPAPA